MESKDAERDLQTLDHLQWATKVEARRVPAWSIPALAVGLGLFIITVGAHPLLVGSCWVVFVAGWVVLGRRRNRATPLPALSRREVAGFLVAGVAAFAVFGILMGSAAAGLASGAVGTIAGLRAAWRGSHQ